MTYDVCVGSAASALVPALMDWSDTLGATLGLVPYAELARQHQDASLRHAAIRSHGNAIGTQPGAAPSRRRSRNRTLDGMLHDRYDECLDTLSAERMAFEAAFRHTDADGTEWLYHLSLSGESGSGLDLSNSVDRAHHDFALRCKEPGWQELRPVLMLVPRPIQPLIEAWCREGRVAE